MADLKAVDTEEYVEGLAPWISRKAVVEILQESFNTKAEPKSISGTRLDEGTGYMSIIVSLKVEWPDSVGAISPEKLILKLPTLLKAKDQFQNLPNPPPMDMMDFFLQHTHDNECRFYDLLKKTGSSLPPCPTVYGHRKLDPSIEMPGYLLLEDLSLNGGISSFIDGLTKGQTEQAVIGIAKFQAFCIQFPESKDAVQQMPPDAFDGMPDVLNGCIQILQNEYKDVVKNERKELERFTDMEVWLNSAGKTGNLFFVHGDLWTNNIIFERNEQGELGDKMLGIIDFQQAHVGNPMEDICRFFASSLTPQIRRKHQDHFVELYHKTLQELLPNGFPGSMSLEETKACYKETYMLGAGIFMFHFPLIIKGYLANESLEVKRSLAARLAANIEDALEWNPL